MNKEEIEKSLEFKRIEADQLKYQIEELEKRLEEIKDEPISAVVWMLEKYNCDIPVGQTESCWDYQDMIYAFKAGAAENEKKHRSKQSFEEICAAEKMLPTIEIRSFYKACEKNRGFDD